MRFALGILKVWQTNGPPSIRLSIHFWGPGDKGPPNEIGQAHCQPRFLHGCLRDGGTGDPSTPMEVLAVMARGLK